MNKITIQYYRKNVYGKTLEYVADKGQAQLVHMITGQKTIDARIRSLMSDLMGPAIEFKEVIAP